MRDDSFRLFRQDQMEPGKLYEITPDRRLLELEWQVKAWRVAAWTSLGLLTVPACIVALWWIDRAC